VWEQSLLDVTVPTDTFLYSTKGSVLMPTRKEMLSYLSKSPTYLCNRGLVVHNLFETRHVYNTIFLSTEELFFIYAEALFQDEKKRQVLTSYEICNDSSILKRSPR
jgi:hypothetical protein